MEFGVVAFVDYANATKFLSRLNVPMTGLSQATVPTIYADFTDGKKLVNYTGPRVEDTITALETYLELCEKYEDMLIPGLWNFPNAGNIPDDLLMKFSDFAVKYNVTAAVPLMYITNVLGVGEYSHELTMTVMQTFGGQMARAVLGRQRLLAPASHRIQDVYDAMAEVLGNDAVYSSTVVASKRTRNGVSVTVRSQDTGVLTTIQAKHLLLAINPIMESLGPFDLDAKEAEVFSKLEYTRLYTALLRNPSLPANETLQNLPLAAENGHYLETQAIPYVAEFGSYGIPGRPHRTVVVGDKTLESKDAKRLLQHNFQALVRAGTLGESDQPDLQFVAFSDHGPMHLRVSAEDYKAGYVQELLGLQGHRSTWYTGAGYAGAQLQTVIWAYNDILISKMMKS